MNVTDVTIWLLCGDFIFDVVGLPQDVKIVARFYKIQYEHMKRDSVCFFFKFPGGKNRQNWIDDI